MLKKIFHTLVVSFLSLLFLFGSTAKEFVHTFTHHEDTVHNPQHTCPPGEAHFEQEHHHCSFLHFVLEPFSNDAFLPRIIGIPSIYYAIKNAVVAAKFIPFNVDQSSSRGPPAAVA